MHYDMKILQINSVCGFGSTGRTTVELANFLHQKGHECFIAYGHGTTNYKYSYKIGSRLENNFHNLVFTRILGLHGRGTIFGTWRFLRWIEKIKPDIIHIRNLHANYVNHPMLFKYIIKNNIPVVITLHDCTNFTGSCSHYTANECYKWKTQCVNCEFHAHITSGSKFFDNTDLIYSNRKKWYAQIKKMSIVAVSKWLEGEARQSILAGNGHKITCIYNWIDYNKFQRASDVEISNFKEKYKLQENYKYLITVGAGWDQKSTKYADAVALSRELPDDYKLVLVGSLLRGTVIPKDIIYIPYIHDTKELSIAYSMAEAYIHLSVEDTFGKVIAEAMMCGTVPITFNSTACGEISGPFGITVKPHNIMAIVKQLPSLNFHKKKREEMVSYVKMRYDYKKNALKYVELYNTLLNDK